MPKKKVSITGITGGRAKSRFNPYKNQFESSCGIDPDLTISQTSYSSGGIATPSIYSKISGTNVNAAPIAIITCPKTTNIYTVLSNGRLVSYSKTLGSETLIGTVFGGNAATAGGACYYNNYIYILGTGNELLYNTCTHAFTVGATLTGVTSGTTAIITADDGVSKLTLKTIAGDFTAGETITDGSGGSAKVTGAAASRSDVSRYGPLDGTPTLVNGWWNSLGLTPLTNTTYPVVGSAGITQKLPNHWGWVHADNSLYFLDFSSGQGLVHRIHTKKVTYEGDTDDTTVPSAYNVLDLPFGFYPTSIASYGTSVAILAIQTISYEMNQGNSALFLWNPTNTDTFDQQINISDSLASSLIVRNGYLHIFSGSAQTGGIRISTYSGGDTVSEINFIEEGIPPYQGGVEIFGNKLLFGTFCMSPLEFACVYSLNSRVSNSEDLQNVAIVGTSGITSPMVFSIKNVSQQSDYEFNPQILIGAYDSTSGYAIYKKNSFGTVQSRLVFPPIIVGAEFNITKMRIPLANAVASGTVITPLLTYDDGTQTTLTAISNTTHPSANKVIYRAQEMTQKGINQFQLTLEWDSSTAATSVMFPIEFELDVAEDERN